MTITPLAIEGAWLVQPTPRGDARGTVHEWLVQDAFAQATGARLDVAQANLSTSRAGVVRGVHVADPAVGQAKYVTCAAGAALDVVVDLRVGSPTFGHHETVLLDDVDRAGVYVSAGLGHATMALADDTVFVYLVSRPFVPGVERSVNPMCPELGIDWPSTGRDGAALDLVLGDRDRSAPGLHEAMRLGVLPRYKQQKVTR